MFIISLNRKFPFYKIKIELLGKILFISPAEHRSDIEA